VYIFVIATSSLRGHCSVIDVHTAPPKVVAELAPLEITPGLRSRGLKIVRAIKLCQASLRGHDIAAMARRSAGHRTARQVN
jgi:hypothetical protein